MVSRQRKVVLGRISGETLGNSDPAPPSFVIDSMEAVTTSMDPGWPDSLTVPGRTEDRSRTAVQQTLLGVDPLEGGALRKAEVSDRTCSATDAEDTGTSR